MTRRFERDIAGALRGVTLFFVMPYVCALTLFYAMMLTPRNDNTLPVAVCGAFTLILLYAVGSAWRFFYAPPHGGVSKSRLWRMVLFLPLVILPLVAIWVWPLMDKTADALRMCGQSMALFILWFYAVYLSTLSVRHSASAFKFFGLTLLPLGAMALLFAVGRGVDVVLLAGVFLVLLMVEYVMLMRLICLLGDAPPKRIKGYLWWFLLPVAGFIATLVGADRAESEYRSASAHLAETFDITLGEAAFRAMNERPLPSNDSALVHLTDGALISELASEMFTYDTEALTRCVPPFYTDTEIALFTDWLVENDTSIRIYDALLALPYIKFDAPEKTIDFGDKEGGLAWLLWHGSRVPVRRLALAVRMPGKVDYAQYLDVFDSAYRHAVHANTPIGFACATALISSKIDLLGAYLPKLSDAELTHEIQKIERLLPIVDFSAEHVIRTHVAEMFFFHPYLFDEVCKAHGLHLNDKQLESLKALGAPLTAIYYLDGIKTTQMILSEYRMTDSQVFAYKDFIIMPPRYAIFSNIACGAVGRLRHTVQRLRQQVGCLKIGVAVERYRRKNGALPENLDALVPTFLDSVPVAVTTGKPFRYRHGAELERRGEWVVIDITDPLVGRFGTNYEYATFRFPVTEHIRGTP